MEIERKYLLDQLPENLTSYPCKKIEQGYLSTEPVVRIRRSDDEYYLTYKSKGLMVREEYNLPLTKAQLDHCGDQVFVGKLVIDDRTVTLDDTLVFQRSDGVGDFCLCHVQHNRQLRIGESGVLLQ